MEERDFNLTRRNLLRTTGVLAGGSVASGGLFGISSDPASAQTTVIEDFEDGGLTEYSFDRGSSGASLVSSPVYQGSSALEISGTDTEMVSTSGLDTYPAAGETFRFRFRSPTNEVANLSYGVQNQTNRYFVQLDYADQYLKLVRGQNGTGNQFGIGKNVPYTTGVWYDVEVEWRTDGTHVATLYDTNGTQVAQATGTDTTWTSGGIGFDGYYAGGGAGYYDYVTLETSGGGGGGGSGDGRIIGDGGDGSNIIDDFEDGNLSEYTHDPSRNGQASLVSSPTIHDNQALAISNEDAELISLPGNGLTTYPSQGDVFVYHLRGTGGAARTNFRYGVQDHKNGYFVRVNLADDRLKLFKYQTGNSTQLAKQTSGFTLDQDTWYKVEVKWGTDGTHTVTLTDMAGTQLAQVNAPEGTWTSGGVGYDAYLASSGATAYFDYVKITRYERAHTSQELSDAKSRLQNSNQYSIIKQKLESEGYTVDLSSPSGQYVKVPHHGVEGDVLDVPVNGSNQAGMHVFDLNSSGEPQVAAGGVVDSDTKFLYFSDQAMQDGTDNQMIEWTFTEGTAGGA